MILSRLIQSAVKIHAEKNGPL